MGNLAVLSGLSAVAWLPIIFRFYGNWKDRRNPVSLAICGCLCFLVYVHVMFAFTVMSVATWNVLLVGAHAFSLVTLINFYASFYWAKRRFPEARHETAQSEDPPRPAA